MSDYISKNALIEVLKGNKIDNISINDKNIIDVIEELPTLDEAEIIRRTLERIIHSIDLIKDCADESFEDGCNACLHKIKMELYDFKEEGGIE